MQHPPLNETEYTGSVDLSDTKTCTCSACNIENEQTSQYCKNCGMLLSAPPLNTNFEEDSNVKTPVSGCLSTISVPAGILLTLILLSFSKTQDSWGLISFLLLSFIVFVSAIFGIIVGAFAIIPRKNMVETSNLNRIFGIIGIVINAIVLFIILFFLKR